VLRFVRAVDYPYSTTSVFPFEIACFLHDCAQAGVRCIVECGRMHGYSTAVLDAYGRERGVRIVSIDYEVDAEIARQCRARLATVAPNVELVRADAFRALPRLLAAERRSIALLVDGPKDHYAVYLSAAAAASGHIHLVAHHNVYEKSEAHFRARFPNAHRPESSPVLGAPTFTAFREWERTLIEGTPRDLDRSSLLTAVLAPPGPNRRYLRGPTPRQTRLAHAIRWWWRLGAPPLWFLKFPLTGLGG
jgi:hypothetical protein